MQSAFFSFYHAIPRPLICHLADVAIVNKLAKYDNVHRPVKYFK